MTAAAAGMMRETTPAPQRHLHRWQAQRSRQRQTRALRGCATSSACGTLPLWISYEPAIGPLLIRGFEQKPDWIVFGGETGAQFRTMQLEWAENLLAECREFRVPFYMKQVAARSPGMGKEFIPPHLNVQEFRNFRSPHDSHCGVLIRSRRPPFQAKIRQRDE
jgi:hypothetical protein